MLGDIFRVVMTMEDGTDETAILKFSADREDLRVAAKRAGIFEREVNFYRHIAPRLKCRIPRCFGAWFDAETAEFVIVMEFIDADPSVQQTKGVSLTQARTVVRELSELHVPANDFVEFSNFIMPASAEARRINQRMFVTNGWSKLRERVSVELRVSFTPEEMADKVVAAIDFLASQPYFLSHGDARPDNLLFSRDGTQVALVDWQGLMFGPREWDLGYFMAQGLRTEDRREWVNELVDYYIDLVAAKGEQLDRSTVMTNVGKAAWFSFGVACSLFTVADTSQQKTLDLAGSMGERSLAMLLDAGEL